MIQKGVLVPFDFEPKAEAALEYACALAPMYHCGIRLLYVIESGDFISELFRSEEDTARMKQRVLARLEETASMVRRNYGLEVSLHVEKGEPYQVILSLAKEWHSCAIVMGKEGRTLMSHSILGSDELRVVGMAPCPVFTVPAPADAIVLRDTTDTPSQARFAHLVLPLDLYKHTQQKLKMAIKLARIYGSTIHVVSVLIGGIQVRESRIFERMQRASRMLDDLGIAHTAQLYSRPAQPVEEVIFRHARDVRGDLIVMMTHQEATTSDNYIGAVAQRVIQGAEIPVLSMTSSATQGAGFMGVEFVDPFAMFKKHHIH